MNKKQNSRIRLNTLFVPCIKKVPFGNLPEERLYILHSKYYSSLEPIKKYTTNTYPTSILFGELVQKPIKWQTTITEIQKKNQQITLIPIKFPKEIHGKTINEFTCIFHKNPTQEVLIKIKFNREKTLENPYITEIRVIKGERKIFEGKKVLIKTIKNRYTPEDVKIVLQIK